METTLLDRVKSWVQLDNQIRNLNARLKELRKEKKTQNESMIQLMKDKEIDNFDLKDGQIQYKRATKREPLTQSRLLAILSAHPQFGAEQARMVHDFVMENRQVIETDVIVRKTPKKKKEQD
jgi:TolA-binding protein